MRYRWSWGCVIIAMGSCAMAAQPDVRIPFANYGGIRDWQADGDRALYIQGRNNRWYRAELLGACTDLPFAEHVGFVVEPSGEFDRFSAIVVHRRQCMVKSLTDSDPPPKRASKAAGAAAAGKGATPAPKP